VGIDQGKITARRPPSPHKFTRSGLSVTYLPVVARPLSCSCWFGLAEGRGRRDGELRVGRGIGQGGADSLMPPRWFRVFPAGVVGARGFLDQPLKIGDVGWVPKPADEYRAL
jgi:hypothetical protein